MTTGCERGEGFKGLIKPKGFLVGRGRVEGLLLQYINCLRLNCENVTTSGKRALLKSAFLVGVGRGGGPESAYLFTVESFSVMEGTAESSLFST